jgi:hypothetical protein
MEATRRRKRHATRRKRHAMLLLMMMQIQMMGRIQRRRQGQGGGPAALLCCCCYCCCCYCQCCRGTSWLAGGLALRTGKSGAFKGFTGPSLPEPEPSRRRLTCLTNELERVLVCCPREPRRRGRGELLASYERTVSESPVKRDRVGSGRRRGARGDGLGGLVSVGATATQATNAHHVGHRRLGLGFLQF